MIELIHVLYQADVLCEFENKLYQMTLNKQWVSN